MKKPKKKQEGRWKHAAFASLRSLALLALSAAGTAVAKALIERLEKVGES